MEILILFAGGAAETRFGGRRNFVGARKDRSSAINLAGLLYSDTAELEAYLRWLAIRADNLLKRPGTWEAVEAIAGGLLERRKLTGRQVRKLYKVGRENALLAVHARSRCPEEAEGGRMTATPSEGKKGRRKKGRRKKGRRKKGREEGR